MDQENIPTVQPAKRATHVWRILAIIAIIIIIGMAVSIATWVHAYRNLNASAQIHGNELIIQNNDDYTWFDPYVVLNTDYTFNTFNIPPHNKFTVQITAFRKGYTSDFFPADDRPTDLYIYARISQYQWSCWFYKFQ